MTTAPVDVGDRGDAFAGCPLLRSEHSWRRSRPSRDHRCHGVHPAVRVDTRKQWKLCLVADHHQCQTYVAAMGPASEGSAVPSNRWSYAPSTVTLHDPDGLRQRLRRPPVRSVGQALLAVLLAGSLIALGSGRLPSFFADGGARASAGSPETVSPRPSTAPSLAPSGATSTPSPTAPPSAPPNSPTPSAPSPVPESSPATTTYVVRPGDTLYAIALRFGTTVSAIQALNGITDPSQIRPGEVLQIP